MNNDETITSQPGIYFYADNDVLFGKPLVRNGMWFDIQQHKSEKKHHVREDHMFDNIDDLLAKESEIIQNRISECHETIIALRENLSTLKSKCDNMSYRITDLWANTMHGVLHQTEDYFSGYCAREGRAASPSTAAVFLDKLHPQIKVLKKAGVVTYFFEPATFTKL